MKSNVTDSSNERGERSSTIERILNLLDGWRKMCRFVEVLGLIRKKEFHGEERRKARLPEVNPDS